jgi:hypothetical protein
MLTENFVFDGGGDLRIGLDKRERHTVGHTEIVAGTGRPGTCGFIAFAELTSADLPLVWTQRILRLAERLEFQ